MITDRNVRVYDSNHIIPGLIPLILPYNKKIRYETLQHTLQ